MGWNIDKSKLASSNNIMRTKALFIDMCYESPEYALYTLSPFHNTDKDLPSIYLLYLEMEDLEEFEFANTYFLGMDHWRKLCECEWFKPTLSKMREDLQSKIKGRALHAIRKEAENPDSKNYFQSLKYLADKGYMPKSQKGRPSKAQIEKAAREKADQHEELNNIIERMDIHPREIN